jgi:hypoxanthine-DNA glycosylase
LAQADTAFAPVVAADARILILGSLPGQRSLEATQYYAHRQNAFWKIMGELYGVAGDYEQRCRQLTENHIALWAVLASAVRPGSMDADIRTDTATPNDFDCLLTNYPDIQKICFNGQKAANLFARLVTLPAEHRIVYANLPSTSPAYAAMSFDDKLEKWASKLELKPLTTGERT